MNRQQIKDARSEALRFVGDCDEALKRLDYEVQISSWKEKASSGDRSYGSKETGQLRRTSLDLTRALAKLRNPS